MQLNTEKQGNKSTIDDKTATVLNFIKGFHYS